MRRMIDLMISLLERTRELSDVQAFEV